MKEAKFALGIGIALSAVVYALTSSEIQPHLLSPESAYHLPSSTTLYLLVWGGMGCLFLGMTKPRFRNAIGTAILAGLLGLFVALIIRVLPVLIWGGFSSGEFIQYLTVGFLHAPPKIAPWYVFVGHLLYICVLVVGETVLPFIAVFSLFSETGRTAAIGRGRNLLSFQAASDRAAVEREKEPGAFLYWGWLELPWSFATKHFLACGSTGSGKTTLIRILMQSVIPRIGAKPDERALIYDAKQDVLSILCGMNLASTPVLLNPFDSRCSAWDIAADVTEPSTAQQIATILIPEEKNASQRFFSDAARHLLGGVMRRFIKTAPGRWTLSDVVYVMLDQGRLENLLSSDPETASLLTYLRDARTGNSVLSTVLTKMQPYEFIAAAWSRAEKKVSLRNWVKGDYILILGNDEAQRSALDAINQAIFKRIVELVLAQENSTTRRTWFVLDEVREAGRLEGLQSLLTKGRSKGASVVLGFQDIDGMKEVYGEHLASEITGQCACKALLRTDSPKTADWASAILGDREFVELTHSNSSNESSSSGLRNRSSTSGTSRSTSEHIVKRPVALPSELMTLPLPGGDGKGPLAGYFLAPNIGAYFANIRWDSVEENLLPQSEIPNLVRREVDHEVLRPWNEMDLERLGINRPIQAQQMEIETLKSDRAVSQQDAIPNIMSLRDAAVRIRER